MKRKTKENPLKAQILRFSENLLEHTRMVEKIQNDIAELVKNNENKIFTMPVMQDKIVKE
jgi:hypothetical protein